MHQTVLLKEAILALNVIPNGIYIDGTYGRGGHSREILDKLGAHGKLFAFDKDQTAIESAKKTIQDKRFTIIHGSFTKLKTYLVSHKLLGKINGVLLDLGVSSPQIDNAERGFSFMHNGPLDMRMDLLQKNTARDFINKSSIDEMIYVFKEYGEEKFSKRIAQAIGKARENKLIETTGELAEIIKKAHPQWDFKKHPATKIFQAIRIHVNSELADLSEFLSALDEVMALDGRLVVISFHSLEDKLIKRFLQGNQRDFIPKNIPIKFDKLAAKKWRKIGKKIVPSREEIENNPRARSAVMRIGEKIL